MELDTSKALNTFRATVSDVVGKSVVAVGKRVGDCDAGGDVLGRDAEGDNEIGRSVVGVKLGLAVGVFVVGCLDGRDVGTFDGEPGKTVGTLEVGSTDGLSDGNAEGTLVVGVSVLSVCDRVVGAKVKSPKLGGRSKGRIVGLGEGSIVVGVSVGLELSLGARLRK